MALKYIVFASFALTGSLFYLSKSGADTSPALPAPVITPAEILESPKAPTPKKLKNALAVAVPPVDDYGSLLPAGGIHPMKSDFYANVVVPTIQYCFKALTHRRKETYEARDGDAEISFNGEIILFVSFDQGQPTSIQSRSAEIRDARFHSCMESGMKKWAFPSELARQPTWRFSQKLSYDVNYKYRCSDLSRTVVGSPKKENCL